MAEIELGERGQILVIGAKSSNFSQEHRMSPRVIFWKINKNSEVPDKIPCRVVVVIFSRFISHAIRHKVIKMAQSNGARFFRICENTGEIRRHIDTLLSTAMEVKRMEKETLLVNPVLPVLNQKINSNGNNKENSKEKEMVMSEQSAPIKSLETVSQEKTEKAVGVSDFINKNANFYPESNKQELLRLLGLAKSQGINTTAASLNHAFYRLRKKQTIKEQATPTKKDSSKFLAEFIGNLELAAVAIQEILDENGKLIKENIELKKEAATMIKIKALFKSSS